ncbi:tRNA (adenine(58)-N(1))-methyltransferase non-catalytic subunit TRM6 [Habropoda laboriosa]|uniref:tRNA (adenine(58)-N(1))-methyltransferase non-catalytic subunit TRM6 n=1 Tax=Habropoda laboriosa TaxID=597456 RepID=A0A0L7RB24_9HYME|nr:tRNA (adenine(58)-N(1))-methyltransferase non-catalytic subunit TRM6 [Habropoda laboriosa]
MCETEDDIITVGKYVIVKKLNFKKIYKVTGNGTLMLGKDLVGMHEIIGKRFWTTFEMVSVKEGKRMFSLKEVVETESLNDLLNELPSGCDNRSIIDDGTSQKLSKEEILQFQESGKSGKEIVVDHRKIGNLRMDTLAQLLSYSDVQSDGLYILYDSGSQGLPAAALLNRIGSNTEGHLINLHPGNVPQAMLVNAMNFPKEQLDRLVNVNIYSFLRLYYQGESAVLNNISKKSQNKKDLSNVDELNEVTERNNEIEECSRESSLKRKLKDSNESEEVTPIKKPRWLLETQHAVELVKNSKARGLAIIAKEHPLNIAMALLPFLGLSRPFVIYHIYREPLQETYMMLKQKQNVINLRLFSNFIRSYQVLPDRTHPDILTSDTGGYLLTGYLV